MVMIYRCLIALLFVAMIAGCASRRDERNKPAAASAAAQPAPAPAAEPAPAPSSRRTMAETTPSPKPGDYGVGGPLPGMEVNRKINEQDCRSSIDLLAGNLLCK